MTQRVNIEDSGGWRGSVGGRAGDALDEAIELKVEQALLCGGRGQRAGGEEVIDAYRLPLCTTQ